MGNFYGIPDKSTLETKSVDLSQHLSFEDYMIQAGRPNVQKGIADIPINLFPVPNVIERLNASFNRLPTIPDPLPFHLPHLTRLDLSHNQITTLPDTFRYFLHLKTLYLDNNVLRQVPPSVFCLPQLEQLDVSSNQLTTVSRDLESLDRLRRLHLSNNMISGFVLSRHQAVAGIEVVVAYYTRSLDPPQEICDKGSVAILEYFRKKYGNKDGGVVKVGAGDSHLEFPRLRGSISEALLNAKLSPSGQPTARQLQRASLRSCCAASTLESGEIADRVCGLIYGAALGDAIGLCTEFMTQDQCQFHYGGEEDGMSISNMVRDRHRLKWTPGDWTDDTDQLILLLDSVILWGGVIDEVDFAERLLQWSQKGFPELGDSVGFGIGNTVGKCLNDKDFLKNPHEVAQKVWKATGSAANGAVMRTAILGVPSFDNIDEVSQNAVRICKATHCDPRCQASCVAVCVLVASLLQGKHEVSTDEGIENMLSAARNAGRPLITDDDHVKDFDLYMSCKDFDSVQCCEMKKIGYTLKPLGAACVALRKQLDFKTTINELVLLGGDADTNAAVAGAVLGCRLGYSRLPSDWMDSLLSKQKAWLNAKINCLLDLMGLP